MATVLSKYDHTNRRFKKGWDWDSDTFSLRLLTSAYTFSAAHTAWASCSAAEVANGSGYTTGGEVLTCSSTNSLLSASDVYWTSLTKTFRSGVIVREGTVDGLTDGLVAYLLWNDTGGGADIVLDGIDFLVRLADGIFTL